MCATRCSGSIAVRYLHCFISCLYFILMVIVLMKLAAQKSKRVVRLKFWLNCVGYYQDKGWFSPILLHPFLPLYFISFINPFSFECDQMIIVFFFFLSNSIAYMIIEWCRHPVALVTGIAHNHHKHPNTNVCRSSFFDKWSSAV